MWRDRKSAKWTATLLLPLAALLAAVGPLVAAEEFGTTEVTMIACRIVADEMTMDEGTVYVRRRVMVAAFLTDDPYFAGRGTVIANANLFPEAGRGAFQGFIEIRPDAFQGFWSGTFAIVVDENGPHGWTVSLGNGPDLQGLHVESALRPLPPAVVAEYAWACGGEAPISGSVAVGRIARVRPESP